MPFGSSDKSLNDSCKFRGRADIYQHSNHRFKQVDASAFEFSDCQATAKVVSRKPFNRLLYLSQT